jgi:hypothetical protein
MRCQCFLPCRRAPYYQVMALSENVKLRLDIPAGDSQQDRLARAADQNAAGDVEPNDEAESQMRRALGLIGDTPRHRAEADRPEPGGRPGGVFNGGLHRRRFVQDGDIPVTVVRRDPGIDVQANRTAAPVSVPSSSRLQRTEAALAAESAAREKAERALNEAYAVVKDLQTKIGHAELAKNEALESLRREREAAALLRGEADDREARAKEAEERALAAEETANEYHDQLIVERHARKTAEKALRAAEAAREEAEQLVRTLSEEAPKLSRAAARRFAEPLDAEPEPAEPPRRGRPVAEPEVAAAARRQRAAEEPEPEPVKWWLNTKPGPKRR